jgi:molybdenum cofactor cytidylyltransferase
MHFKRGFARVVINKNGGGMGITIVLLAAGRSTRMRGADKLLIRVDGQPLLARMAGVAQATLQPVVVVLAPKRPDRAAVLANLGLHIVTGGAGMAASIRAGVAAIPADHAVLIMLADMPDVDADDLARMVAAYRDAPGLIHRAIDATGRPGHPVIFPPNHRAALLLLHGDTGARALLAAHRVRAVLLPGTHATTDLDTPEDWAAWRAAPP